MNATDLIARARQRDKRSVGRLISLFEDPRPAAAGERARVTAALAAAPTARFIGITGTPGAGKSTLIGQLALRLIAADPKVSVAVLAIDPTSQVSGGALLGDRTRVSFPPAEDRLFFRSQATDGDLGGIGRATFQVCRLLRHLFDLVIVETVGIGQSEIEIQHLVDWIYLVLQPLAGDEVQFMKAGIMEIPDAFILNKCDQKQAATRSYHALQASLSLARPGGGNPPIHRTSARTGEGLDELAAEILTVRPRGDFTSRERHFFGRWLRDEYGRAGAKLLAERDLLTETGDYDEAQAAARAALG